jgi:hypothetical protein
MRSKSVANPLFILLPLLLLFDCIRNRITSPENPASDIRISAITQDGSDADTRFLYETGMLSAIESMADDSSLWHRHVHFFYKNGRPVQQEFFDAGRKVVADYVYSPDGRINELNCLSMDADGIDRRHCDIRLSYDSSGRISRLDQVFPDGSSWYRTDLTYDVNGNVVEEKIFDSRGLYQSNVKEFDTKVNPTYAFRNTFVMTPVFFSRNNPTSVFSTTFDGSENTESNTVFEYTYDRRGVPLTRKITTRLGGNQIAGIEETYHYDFIGQDVKF